MEIRDLERVPREAPPPPSDSRPPEPEPGPPPPLPEDVGTTVDEYA